MEDTTPYALQSNSQTLMDSNGLNAILPSSIVSNTNMQIQDFPKIIENPVPIVNRDSPASKLISCLNRIFSVMVGLLGSSSRTSFVKKTYYRRYNKNQREEKKENLKMTSSDYRLPNITLVDNTAMPQLKIILHRKIKENKKPR